MVFNIVDTVQCTPENKNWGNISTVCTQLEVNCGKMYTQQWNIVYTLFDSTNENIKFWYVRAIYRLGKNGIVKSSFLRWYSRKLCVRKDNNCTWHRRRIDLEDKVKVVAYAWGAESLPR